MGYSENLEREFPLALFGNSHRILRFELKLYSYISEMKNPKTSYKLTKLHQNYTTKLLQNYTTENIASEDTECESEMLKESKFLKQMSVKCTVWNINCSTGGRIVEEQSSLIQTPYLSHFVMQLWQHA